MKYYSLTLAFFFSVAAKQHFEVITFFLRDYPEVSKTDQNIQIKHHYKGVPATYAGYITVSNKDGQITLPRASQKASINILASKDVKPIFLNKGTIKHWVTTGNADLYKVKRKKNKETHAYLWDVKKSSLKKGKRIPLHTVVLIADPKNIYIPEGFSKTTKNVQLYLPDVYVKKGIETVDDAIFATHIRQYFSPILKLYKGMDNGYQTVIKSLT